jgi:hypothetical protein
MQVEIGTQRYTQVHTLDEPTFGNAYHEYVVVVKDDEEVVANVTFQKGPIAENGVNGCHQEDLLAIVLHRLQCFQSSEYACRENALAITKIEEAMHWLNHRTANRQKRNVEGTSAI